MRLLMIGAAALALTACSKGEEPATKAAAAAEEVASSETLSARDLPRIKAGRWMVRTTSEDGDVEITRQCVGPDQTMAQMVESNGCPASIRRLNGVFSIEGQCNVDGYVSRVRMTMRGDFQRRYGGEFDFSVSAAGREVTRVKQNVVATYEGPCVPGDDEGE